MSRCLELIVRISKGKTEVPGFVLVLYFMGFIDLGFIVVVNHPELCF